MFLIVIRSLRMRLCQFSFNIIPIFFSKAEGCLLILGNKGTGKDSMFQKWIVGRFNEWFGKRRHSFSRYWHVESDKKFSTASMESRKI